MSAEAFEFDVFLSHSSADKPAVVKLARDLERRGLRVWLDDDQIAPGASIPSAIESGLSSSRVLVLCMSKAAFDSDWAALESWTFRFRDPMNRELRFIPVRLDDSPIPESLAQFRYLDIRGADAIDRLAAVCRPPRSDQGPGSEGEFARSPIICLGHTDWANGVAITPDGRHAVTGGADAIARVWDLTTGKATLTLASHADMIWGIAVTPDGRHAVTASEDATARVWDLASGETILTLEGHTGGVNAVDVSADGRHVVTASDDATARVWDLTSGNSILTLRGHTAAVNAVDVSPDGLYVATASADATARVWDMASGETILTLAGHADGVNGVVITPDGRQLVTAADDATARVWDLSTGETTLIFQGHTALIWGLSVTPDGRRAVTAGADGSVRVWDLESGRDILTLEGHASGIRGVAITPDGRRAVTAGTDATARVWDLSTGEATLRLQGHTDLICGVAVTPNGRHAITASDDATARVWDLTTDVVVLTLEGHRDRVWAAAVTSDGRQVVTASDDATARVWDLTTGETILTLEGHTAAVIGVAVTSDGRQAVTASDDATARVWDLTTGETILTLEGHTAAVNGVAVTSDGRQVVTASDDATARVWDLTTGEAILTLEGHTAAVNGVAVTSDGRQVVTASDDATARVWDLTTGRASLTLEGHTAPVNAVAVTPDGPHVVTASDDATARVWDLTTGRATQRLEGHSDAVCGLAITPGGHHAVTASRDGLLRVWTGHEVTRLQGSPGGEDRLYTNAKVVLVGDSQAGKSGLARVLAGQEWRPTESTIGAWAIQLLVPFLNTRDDIEREVWLWDFGGQADQRLIHQLFLKDAAVAVLVFDGQRDDAVQRVWDWIRATEPRRHSSVGMELVPKLLVAARTDINPVRLNATDIRRLREAVGFVGYFETSAKTGLQVAELRDAIVKAIDWEAIPHRSSPEVFGRLRRAILAMKDRGRSLTTVKELLDWLPRDTGSFSLAELEAVIGLLVGPGAVMRLGFDDQVLLQPELLNAYGQAVIRTLAEDPEERGCLTEERLLDGDLDYPPGFQRLEGADEATVLRGLQRELVSRALCIRDDDPTGQRGTLLVFPSYFRRQRPERPRQPSVFTTYRIEGPLEEIYASLVVRLHHTAHFTSSDLWRDVADLTSRQSGRLLGVQMAKEVDGTGRIEIFAEASATRDDRQLLTRFTRDHLHRYAEKIERFRVYVCDACGTAAKDLDLVADKLRRGKKYILCQECEQRIDLVDELEREFGSDQLRAAVAREDKQAEALIARETRSQTIVADVIGTASRAGQLARQVYHPHPGVEITFLDDAGRPSGNRAFVHVDPGPLPAVPIIELDPLWGHSGSLVLYAVRNGEKDPVQWLDITDALSTRDSITNDTTRNIAFDGRRFDIMSVRELRELALNDTSPRDHLLPTLSRPAPPGVATAPAGTESRITPVSTPTRVQAPSPSFYDRAWALIVAAAVVATLIGLGVAIAAFL